jgi:hypothetical protein
MSLPLLQTCALSQGRRVGTTELNWELSYCYHKVWIVGMFQFGSSCLLSPDDEQGFQTLYKLAAVLAEEINLVAKIFTRSLARPFKFPVHDHLME